MITVNIVAALTLISCLIATVVAFKTGVVRKSNRWGDVSEINYELILIVNLVTLVLGAIFWLMAIEFPLVVLVGLSSILLSASFIATLIVKYLPDTSEGVFLLSVANKLKTMFTKTK